MVYSTTYSFWIKLLSRIYLIIPPKKAMSVPERRRAKMWALAEELVNRGSTLISLAPRSMALLIHLKEIG